MIRNIAEQVVLIRGAGEMASGIAYRLHLAHYWLCLTEVANPLAVSRGTTFSEAIFESHKTIGGVTAELIPATMEAIERVWHNGNIPLVIDPEAKIKEILRPHVLVDAIMAKKPTGTKITDAPLVIGIGPGFSAGKDVHIVVETNDSLGNVGKLIFQGEAEENTGIPVEVGGLTTERVVWAPEDGVFTSRMQFGDMVEVGQVIGKVAAIPIKAPISGRLRGLIRNGVKVPQGAKLIEVDPVNETRVFYLIREKIWAVGGGVIEALKLTSGGSKNAGNLS